MAVIRVSGDLGSGKTTLCERLAEALEYENYYTGSIMRQLAEAQGMIIDDFFKELEREPDLEKEIDKKQEELMQTSDDIIVQGRIAPFLDCAFNAVNLYIAVDPWVGARRMSNRPEYRGMTIEQIKKLASKRVAIEKERYQKLYGIPDHLDRSKFDIYIDTTNLTQDEILVSVLAALASFLEKDL